MSNYIDIKNTGLIVLKETKDQLWLKNQIERINPHADEMGSDGEYVDALTTLIFELKETNDTKSK